MYIKTKYRRTVAIGRTRNGPLRLAITSNRRLVEGVVMKYRVLIETDEDGAFTAEVPALPGCVSQGKTRAEAIETIKEAITAYLSSLDARGEPIPPPITEEIVEVIV